MARTSALDKSAMEHRSSPASRAAAARTSLSFCTGIADSRCSIVALLATAVSSCGLGCLGGGLFATECRGEFCEDIIQRLNGGVDVGALQNVRRKEAQHRVTGAIDKDVPLEHLGDYEFGEFRGVEFCGNHETLAAYIDDCLVVRS